MMLKQKMKSKPQTRLAALLMAALMVSGTAYAETANTNESREFSFDQMVITAQRYEKRDLDTPAMVKVYTEEQLKNTGANTVIEALKFSEGLIYNSQGPNGQSISTMTSKVVIRGQEKGTLILIDGVPMNLRGLYSLEDMPVDDVEKIEVMKGGGAVLYGSDATGGVINIITKKKRTDSVKFSGGSDDKQKHSLSLQAGKLGFGYNYDKLGKVDRYGEGFDKKTGALTSYSDLKKSEKNMTSWNYQFDKNWSVSQLYSTDRYGYQTTSCKTGKLTTDNDYDTTQDRLFLRYDSPAVKGTIYNNYRTIRSSKLGSASWAQSEDKTQGLDLQKEFSFGTDKLIFGGSAQKEFYNSGTAGTKEYDRMVYSVFTNWNHPLSDMTNITLSARETWTGSEENDHNYSKFTPQVQLLRKLDKETSAYASVGQSFIMPTFAQLYGQTTQVKGDPNIKPQTGTHYEIGLKKINESHAWRLAAFHYKIDDFISTNTSDPNQWYTENENQKDTGVELSCDINGTNGWSFNWGVTWQNLQVQSSSVKQNTPWVNKYGKWLVNGGVNYSKDKWTASLMGNYLADRTLENNYNPKGVKPMFLTSMRLAYKPVKEQEVYLTIDNLLDRRDVTTHSSATSAYYTPERSFELGYRFIF
ncbi:MAG: TonB-dependent receptor [Veillonellales bacterium]